MKNFQIDLSIPTLLNIKCKDHCLLCDLGYKKGDKIQIFYCDLELCEKHLEIINEGAIRINV